LAMGAPGCRVIAGGQAGLPVVIGRGADLPTRSAAASPLTLWPTTPYRRLLVWPSTPRTYADLSRQRARRPGAARA